MCLERDLHSLICNIFIWILVFAGISFEGMCSWYVLLDAMVLWKSKYIDQYISCILGMLHYVLNHNFFSNKVRKIPHHKIYTNYKVIFIAYKQKIFCCISIMNSYILKRIIINQLILQLFYWMSDLFSYLKVMALKTLENNLININF